MTQSLTMRVNTELRKDGCRPAGFQQEPRPLTASADAFGYRQMGNSSRKPKTNIVTPHSADAGHWGAVRVRARCAASGEYKSMKSRETLIRLKKLQVDEKRRRVTQIEMMISEFERIAGELDREIKAEQD